MVVLRPASIMVSEDSKGCWIVELSFPNCSLKKCQVMYSGQIRRDMFGLSIMQIINYMCPKVLFLGRGQDWEDEKQETGRIGNL